MIAALNLMVSTLVSFVLFLIGLGAQGETSWDAEAFKKSVENRVPSIVSDITFGKVPPPRVEVTWDPIFLEAFEKIEEGNGFSVEDTSKLMPDAFYYSRWQAETFPWFYNGIGDWMLDRSMYYHEQDNTVMKTITRIGGVMIKMPVSMHFEAEPVAGKPNEYQFVAHFKYSNGETVPMRTGNFYNTETGFIGAEKGMGNMGFNYFVKEGLLTTTQQNWQRSLGYTKVYDMLFLQSTDLADIETVRLKFPYEGKNWMVQLWKGRYINMPGGEVGFYNRESSIIDPLVGDLEFYNVVTDEERIGMTFKIIDKRSNKTLIDKPMEVHWWQTGFFNYPEPLNYDNLTLETILAPQDDAMLEAIIAQLEKEKAAGVLDYTRVNTNLGKGVHVVW